MRRSLALVLVLALALPFAFACGCGARTGLGVGAGAGADASSSHDATRDAPDACAPGAPKPCALAVGLNHTCAIMAADGSVRCWGRNDKGELGDGTLLDRPTATAVVGLGGVANARSVAAGYEHTCALLADGTLRCWGSNFSGQLGASFGGPSHTTPAVVDGLSSVVAVSAGGYHTCAIVGSATPLCWGANENGQLGDGTTTDRFVPAAVAGLTKVTSISASRYHTCAVVDDGTVRCWGNNTQGGLGDGTTETRTTPVVVTGVTGARDVSAGEDHSCALLADGTVTCWGWNYFGQIGDGTNTNRLAATPVIGAGVGCVDTLSAGLLHVCVRSGDASLACWGANNAGQLGDDTLTNRSSAAPVPGVAGTTQLGIGGSAYHACAVLADGSIECWGQNTYGELGDGTTTDHSATPVKVIGVP